MNTRVIALTGSPNAGKTALFNALTGGKQKVANYAGVTVERKEGKAITPSGQELCILDLPGTYSLDPRSPDEEIALDVLLDRRDDVLPPEVLVSVADATNLERSLSFVLELRTLGKPVVLALNMMDLATKRGLDLDLELLSKELLVPVVPTVAVHGKGIQTLLKTVESMMSGEGQLQKKAAVVWAPPTEQQVRARYAEVDRVLNLATRRPTGSDTWTEKIDRCVLHPFWGHLVLLVVMAIVFQSVFSWAAPFMDLIEEGVGALSDLTTRVVPAGAFQDLLVEGAIAGVGAVVVFLPQILILFLFLLTLEDSGYMARAAFLMDRSMGKVGLHGRAFIPLLSSFACAIPGIMAARTIGSKRDRIATIFIAPLMTCSARLPVYALLIAAFIPPMTVAGVLNLQGLVLLGLYLAGIVFALLVASVLKTTKLRGPKPPLLIDLPSYKMPNYKNVLFGLLERTKLFLRRAGKYILLAAVALWVLASYPKAPENANEPAIHYSYAAKIGKAIEPVIRPLGFDWRIGTGLVPGFAAREVMVGALATVFAVEAEDEEATEASLSSLIQGTWGLATALSLLVWYVFSPQCLATFAVMKRETNSWAWTSASFLTLLGLAYLFSFLTYQIVSRVLG